MFHLRRLANLHHPDRAMSLPPAEKRLVVAVGLFACLALLAVWEIESIRAAPLDPSGALILGAILGATTAAGLVVRRRWRHYLASRA